MTLSQHRLFLVCILTAAYLLPGSRSLSIPDPEAPNTIIVPDDSLTSTSISSISTDDGPETTGTTLVEKTDAQQSNWKSQTSRRATNEEFPEGTTTNDSEIEPTTESDLSGADNTQLNDTLSGESPVMEVVDLIFRPFKQPTILILDFFTKSNITKDTGSESNEDNSTSTEISAESNKDSTLGVPNEAAREKLSVNSDMPDWRDSSSLGETKGVFHFTNAHLSQGEDEPTTTKKTTSSAQKQFSTSDDDDASQEKGSKPNIFISSSNDDEDEDSLRSLSTTVPSVMTDSSLTDNNQRRRRETHQESNNSKRADNASSGESDITSVSTSTPTLEKVTGKSQLEDDMTTTSSSGNNNDDDSASDVDSDDDDNDADDNGQHKNKASKSGTVKVFLEILQLVPISNTTDDGGNDDDGSGATHEAAEKEESEAKTVIHSLKANSNQKFSTANSTTTAVKKEETHEVGNVRRVARSITTSKPPVANPAEKQGNPSSPAASASPSSGKTSKPLTSKDAPAALVPSASLAVKASSANAVVSTTEGPPLINVTEKPIGKSNE